MSEAEWEYAARAGTTTPYYTGTYITGAQANFDGSCMRYNNNVHTIMLPDYVTIDDLNNGTPWCIWRMMTITVGSFAPNEFGLYDMAGNVAQWVQDCWKHYHKDNKLSSSFLLTRGCRDHIARGGGFSHPEWHVRSAYREVLSFDTRLTSVGFRIARTLDNESDEYP